MYSFLDYQFWLFGILFCVAIFLVFFLPGYFILNKSKNLSYLQSFILSLILGLVLWSMQGYIVGYLHLRFLTYLYVFFLVIWGVTQRISLKTYFSHLWKEIVDLDKGVFVLLTIGLILQVLPMVASGMKFGDGVRFYFVNATDGVMHLSYIESIIRSFPPQEPGASGIFLQNYHYWSDLAIAELSRIFFLPVSHLFFQFIPVLLSLITGLLVYSLTKAWKGSLAVARWALFFLYSGADGAYLMYFMLHHTFSFHTPAIDNGVTQFFNMPHAFAKAIFLAGLLTLHFWIISRRKKWGVITIILFTSLFGFKIYYGLFAALGFSLLVAGVFIRSFLNNWKKRGGLHVFRDALSENGFPIVLLIAFAFTAALIYFPTNSGAGGLIFSPLEWPKLLLGEQALNFREWWLRMQVYEQAGNTRNIFIFNTLALFIALISIHGTRLLGFIPNRMLYKTLRLEGVLFLIPGVLVFTFLGFFTLQESGLFNVFNFFVVTLVVLSLFAAFTLSDMYQSKKWVGKVAVLLLVALTLPRIIFETGNVITAYKNNQYTLISNDELEALSFLSKDTKKSSIIQSHPKNGLDSTTPYVSYFSNRATYFTGGGLLATHNQPIERREKNMTDLFMQPNANEFAENLQILGIDYVYVLKKNEEFITIVDQSPHLTVAFENPGVVIYRYVK